MEEEELYLYLATLAMVISLELVRSDSDGKQRPIYFVSKVSTGVETRYAEFDRIELALQVAAKKLCQYFQANTIVVLISSPIRGLLHKPDVSRQLPKWEVELSEFNIKYHPRLAIKGQVLDDIIFESSDVHPCELSNRVWALETDGSSKVGVGGAIMVL